MNKPPLRKMEILLVEDNPGDVRLTREALKDSKSPHSLSVAEDGDAALAYLHREGPYANAPLPDLILLDLNLPRRKGTDVLLEIRAHPVTCRIPVIVLTSSQADSDIRTAYERGANCYLRKPGELEAYFEMIRDLNNFWGSWALLPTH